jgi:hypothetical protein
MTSRNHELEEARFIRNLVIIVALVIVAIIAGVLFFGPPYRVWSQRMAGEAELRRAEFNRQITVREAEAAREAATLLAQAEVERARGVAEANQIIGDSLAGNDMYIRYLWVQGVHSGDHSVIYIPTEGNLPLLEAGGR